MHQPSLKLSAVGTAIVSLITLVLIASSLLMTRIAFFKTGDTTGFWHARVIELTFVVPPIAAIFFAHGLSWWRQGLRLRGALSLAAFPTWAIILGAMDTIIASDFWWLIVGMQLQGIQPFGVPR